MRAFRLMLAALASVLLLAAMGAAVASPSGHNAPGAPVTLKAKLLGSNEKPGPGDPDGTGKATVVIDPATGQVCFKISSKNLTLPSTNAHILEAPKGMPGPVVVQLAGPDGSGKSNGCLPTSNAQAQEIVDNPAGFYVNVHTTDFPAGAIRGQLHP
jgi:hypothetical protein